MSPKEKAEELYSKMYGQTLVRNTIAEIEEDKQCAKQCALIAVNEMIRITPWSGNIDNEIEDFSKEFYMKVKKEIELL